jgi:hypothetical protein
VAELGTDYRAAAEPEDIEDTAPTYALAAGAPGAEAQDAVPLITPTQDFSSGIGELAEEGTDESVGLAIAMPGPRYAARPADLDRLATETPADGTLADNVIDSQDGTLDLEEAFSIEEGDDPASTAPPEPLDTPMTDDETPLPEDVASPELDSANVETADLGNGSDSESAVADSMWFEPTALLDRLEKLSQETGEPEVRRWAEQATQLIQELGTAVSRGSDETRRIVDQLIAHGRLGDSLCDGFQSQREATRLRYALHAFGRRLDVWRYVIAWGGPRSTESQLPEPNLEDLRLCLQKLDWVTRGSMARLSWRGYLCLDRLKQMAQEPAECDASSRKELCRLVLRRLTRVPMTAAQRRFVNGEPMLALRSQLRYWAAEPVHFAALLEQVEKFETSGLPSDAWTVAEHCQSLGASPVQAHRELNQPLEMHYRNANLRIAVAEPLLNRLVPERDAEFEWVRDYILGTPVRGQSWNHSDVSVRLVPDPDRLRFGLRVNGLVSALTSSTSGPATFYNDSQSTYLAWKEFGLSTGGIATNPTRVSVDNATSLRRLRTKFDIVPVLNMVVRGVAKSQLKQREPAAKREVKQKISAKASKSIDNEVFERITEVNRQYEERVLQPLRNLSLQQTMVESKTTEGRLTMRVRLASTDQLGGHTPRPRAPSDSLASVQVHESAVNNLIDKLDLNGRTFTPAELQGWIAEQLCNPEISEIETEADDVRITFAEKDAVTVRFQDGQIVVTVSIAQLARSPRRWKHFQVRAFYRPEVRGLSAELVRDGVIHLMGENLRTRNQIALRGIFGKIFHKDRALPLTPEEMTTDPRLTGLQLTQLVVEEGWIGAAIGPRRSQRFPVAGRPSGKTLD